MSKEIFMSEIFAARFDHIHTNCSDNISMTSYEHRDVSTGATGATEVAPKFSDT